MAYFAKFPLLDYTLQTQTGIKTVFVRNILRRIGLTEDLKNGNGVFLEYDIKDGERPEHIAERVYGDTGFHWLVLMTNTIIDPYHGWYKSGQAMESYIQTKYSGNSVYIGTTAGNWFYSGYLASGTTGSTLSQGSVQASVNEYQPELCKVTVSTGQFSEGTATLTDGEGTVHTVNIYRVDPSYTAVHHFEITRPTGSCGASEKFTVDPLSQQTSSYDYMGGFVGGFTDVYPIADAQGLDYSPSGTVSLSNTYIGNYLGIGGTKVNTYSVSNYLYENEENDKKRTIKILHPRYKIQAVKELETLLGA